MNHGTSSAAKQLQRAVGVMADGNIGPKTLKAAQAREPSALLIQLLTQRAWLYHAIVAGDSSQAVFLEGWFARLFKLVLFINSFIHPLAFYTKPT